MGWKLRKDKQTNETPESDEPLHEGSVAEAIRPSEPLEQSAESVPHADWDMAETQARPAFDLEGDDLDGTVLSEWQNNSPAAPHEEPGDDFAFQDEQDEQDEQETAAIAPVAQAVEPVIPPAKKASKPSASPNITSPSPAPLPKPAVPSLAIPSVAPFIVDAAPPPLPTVARQLVLRIGNLSAAYPIAKEITIIGRPDSALHYYPDIEIELDDAVSRRHAEIVRRGDDYFLIDEGSTNGTLLNGEKLLPHQERQLEHGDHIHVGERTEIIFE